MVWAGAPDKNKLCQEATGGSLPSLRPLGLGHRDRSRRVGPELLPELVSVLRLRDSPGMLQVLATANPGHEDPRTHAGA